ncbi:hypothetical protein SAMN05216229_104267 [Geopseudomonas sagittaria]|uniref:Uncharacterized protein n=1 Tax=Geopseudomonas sagittaria TaxID=1135990 RepID=A0A1I5S9V7_9GAMM|nr:hypothetical protein [Pseudomonas sagittaria]SFP67491.1 hypothetical protein SAMN05216229_104267 [Pseudomonas sagittaria]
MNNKYLSDLADELEAEHGPYPQGHVQLQLWLMANLTMLSGAGIADSGAQRRWLHDRYPAWLRELAEQDLWLNLEDVGLEIVDFPDREQPPDQEREPLDAVDVDFEPPKAHIELHVPDDFDQMGADEILHLFEGGDNEKRD